MNWGLKIRKKSQKRKGSRIIFQSAILFQGAFWLLVSGRVSVGSTETPDCRMTSETTIFEGSNLNVDYKTDSPQILPVQRISRNPVNMSQPHFWLFQLVEFRNWYSYIYIYYMYDIMNLYANIIFLYYILYIHVFYNLQTPFFSQTSFSQPLPVKPQNHPTPAPPFAHLCPAVAYHHREVPELHKCLPPTYPNRLRDLQGSRYNTE